MGIGEQMQNRLTRSIEGDAIQRLRSLIGEDRKKLVWLSKNKPELDLTTKVEHLNEFDTICRELEGFRPLEPWRLIWEKLGEAVKDGFDGDLAVVYFPLKANMPEYYYDTKQVIIDLAGYNLWNPRDYSQTGRLGKLYLASEVNS